MIPKHQVILRFVGRFVYAQPFKEEKALGFVNALAVDMLFNPDVPASRHRFVMSAPRSVLVRRGVRPPDLMIMSKEDPGDGEYGVWDLDGHDVLLEGKNTFDWKPIAKGDPDLPDLTLLSKGSQFDPSSMIGKGPVTGTVFLPVGLGVKKQIIPGKTIEFVRLGDQQLVKGLEMRVADLVDVTIDVPGDVRRLSLKIAKRTGGPVSSVIVTTRPDIPTVVTFSNLCPLPHVEVDEEFAALYEVLKDRPVAADRLVPKELERMGHIDDCYNKGYVAYQLP